jgi:hypothetical protein
MGGSRTPGADDSMDALDKRSDLHDGRVLGRRCHQLARRLSRRSRLVPPCVGGFPRAGDHRAWVLSPDAGAAFGLFVGFWGLICAVWLIVLQILAVVGVLTGGASDGWTAWPLAPLGIWFLVASSLGLGAEEFHAASMDLVCSRVWAS